MSTQQTNPKIICLTGPHGSGKTTIMKKLNSLLLLKFPKVVIQEGYHGGSIDAIPYAHGHSLDSEATFDTQYYLASRLIVADLETRATAVLNNANYIILDQSVFDIMAYTNISKNITARQKTTIFNMLYNHYLNHPVDFFYYLELPRITITDEISMLNQQYNRIIEKRYPVLLNDDTSVEYSYIQANSIDDRVAEIMSDMGFS